MKNFPKSELFHLQESESSPKCLFMETGKMPKDGETKMMNFASADLNTLADIATALEAAIAAKKAEEKAAIRAANAAKKAEEKAAIRAARGDVKLGRPEGTATFDEKWGIVEGLKLIAAKDGFYHYDDAGAAVSRVLTLQLVARGLVETHKAKVTEGPGRAKMFYRLTGKGRSYVALSARWKQPV